LKASIFVFILGVHAAGSVVAQEDGTSLSPRSAMAETSFRLDYGNNQIVERAIDERVIDRLGLFDRADDDSARYSMSLDLENEDSDWSFEVTVTMEF
jgi:hypothetical protein